LLRCVTWKMQGEFEKMQRGANCNQAKSGHFSITCIASLLFKSTRDSDRVRNSRFRALDIADQPRLDGLERGVVASHFHDVIGHHLLFNLERALAIGAAALQTFRGAATRRSLRPMLQAFAPAGQVGGPGRWINHENSGLMGLKLARGLFARHMAKGAAMIGRATLTRLRGIKRCRRHAPHLPCGWLQSQHRCFRLARPPSAAPQAADGSVPTFPEAVTTAQDTGPRSPTTTVDAAALQAQPAHAADPQTR
jgi:hypothetical protein